MVIYQSAESDIISTTDITSETTTTDTYIFEESGDNTGVFEIHNIVGTSDAKIINACTVDDWVDFVYAGDTVRLVCATTTASCIIRCRRRMDAR